MEEGTADPTVVRTIAVHADDVVTALEDCLRRDGAVVLRITPPFHGRMRARLHVPTLGEYDGMSPHPIHVDPRTLVEPVGPYPVPETTEDAIRADPTLTYSPELHHERHIDAIERWRANARASIVDSVELDLPAGPHRVSVGVLG